MEQIIYISSPNSQKIYIWNINNNLALRLIQILNTPGQAQPIVIHPNKKKLYVGTRLIPKIINYDIKKNGSLNQKGTLFISGYSTHLNINKTGSVIYSTSYNNNSLDVIKVDKFGNCISVLQNLTGLMGCHSSNIEITNQRLWIPCLKEDRIRLYDINSTGTLNTYSLKTINVKTNSGPRHMVFHNSYNYAYLINEVSSTINVIKTNKFNHCTPIIVQTKNIIPNSLQVKNTNYGWGSDIHIMNNNHWLYCSDRKTNIISYFKISNLGRQLKYAGYQLTEEQPRGFAIDYYERYLIVAGQKSNFCSIYAINKQTGTLTRFFRFPAKIGPTWISVLNR